MKNKFLILVLMVFSILSLFLVTNNQAIAVSNSYYASTEGLTGHDLLEELAEITLTNHKTKTSYDSLKTHLQQTDKDPKNPNNVLDFYSQISVKGSWDGSTWNREHVWPKSLSGGAYDNNKGGADVHHIRPTINKINSDRGNKKFTDFSMVGLTGDEYRYNGTLAAYYDSNYWEPLDNVKGDTARIVMYMYMHYNDTDIKANSSFDYAGNMQITNIVYGGSTQGAWNILLAWNKLDPVDSFEINRHNYCVNVTGTRNPFIDYPEFADAIWGNGESVNPDDNIGGGETPEPTPVPPTEEPVTPPNPSVGEGDAVLVKDVKELKENDQIIIVASKYNYALGTTQNKNNRAQSSITKDGDYVSFDNNTQVITITKGKLNNTYGLYVDNGYLCSASSSSNYLRTEATLTNNSSWSITFSGEEARLVSQGNYTRNILRYNQGSSLFGCYATGQEPVSIYKISTSEEEVNYVSEVKSLLMKYYNNGIYTKETSINLNEEAQKDLVTYFHAGVNILKRTTYYNKNELWMSKENGLYSYYGTNNEGLTFATTDNPNKAPIDAKVVVKGTTMLDYYTTLVTLKDNEALWSKDGNTYYTTDKKVLKYYLDFTAPCLLSSIFDSKYFSYQKATLEEVDGKLVLKLIIDSDMYNALTNEGNVLSEAIISISDYILLDNATTYINNLDQLKIYSDYNLPTTINGVSVKWSGDNITNNILSYASPENDIIEIIKAELSIGSLVRTVEIEIIQTKYKENNTEYTYTEFSTNDLTIFNNNLGYTIPFIPTDLYEVAFSEEFNAVNYYTYGNTNADYNNYIYQLEEAGFSYLSSYDYDGVLWNSYHKNGNYLDIAAYYSDDIYIIDIYLYISDNSGEPDDGPIIPSYPGYSTLYFNDLSYRTEFSGTKQTWTNGVIALTNAGNCGDYYNPVRLYANTNVEISGVYITSIVFSCAAKTSDKYYAELLYDALSTYYDNVYMSNDTVTLTLDYPTDLVEFNTIKQTRLVLITVYTN